MEFNKKSQFLFLLVSVCISCIINSNPAESVCMAVSSSHQNNAPSSSPPGAPSHNNNNNEDNHNDNRYESSSATPKTETKSEMRYESISAMPTANVREAGKEAGHGLMSSASLLASKAAVAGAGGAAGLKGICDKTDYADLCLSSLTPFSNGSPDEVTALQMSIKAAVEQTKSAIAEITKMMAEPGIAPAKLSKLKDCKDSYSDALDNYQTAMDAIPSRDIGTINSMLSAALTDYGSCDDGFIEFKEKTPMAAFSDKLGQMGSNCLAITSLIH